MSDFEDHPWESAHADFMNNVLPILQREGKKIGEEAQSGDVAAMEIVSVYAMLHRSSDPVTATRLKEAVQARERRLS